MKEEYLDQYGSDGLHHLKIASKTGCDVFLTTNESMLEDREELEQAYNIKIRTPEEMAGEKKNGL